MTRPRSVALAHNYAQRAFGAHGGLVATALVVAAALLALAWPLITQGYALTGVDLQLIFHPYRHYLGTSLAEFRVPLWNPYNAMGVPFAANTLARLRSHTRPSAIPGPGSDDETIESREARGGTKSCVLRTTRPLLLR